MTIKNKEVSVSKWLQNKKVVMTISIVCAVIFWAIINISESPNITKDIHNVPVSISVEGTAAEALGLDVVGGGEDRTVTVTVSGPRYIVAGLSADDITVTASMDNVTSAGNQAINLVATRGSDKIGYTIVGVNPGTITLMVDNFDTRTFDVEINAVGVDADETQGLIAETPMFSADKYSKLTVSGPKTQMDKLAKVVAEAQVNATLSETKSYDAQLKFYDAAGNELDKSLFTFENPTVSITVPILKSKKVPLKATFKNLPTSIGDKVPTYSLDISTVTVHGRADQIDALDHIALTAIDYNEITNNTTEFICTLEIPNGMHVAEENQVTQIKVRILGSIN